MRFLLLLLAALVSTSPVLAEEENAYYLVGWLNGWSTTDKSYPLTLSSDEKSWAITVPANGDDGWFKIAPASAYSSDHFWHYLLNAPYDGCRELSGEMVYGKGGAWRLPNSDGITHYTITVVPSTMQFTITPVSGETPQPQPEPKHDWSGTLPVLFINTEAPVTSKETYVSGSYYLDNQGLEDYESIGSAEAPLPLQIKGRGNYTWTGFDKKPYRLKLDAKAKPLGMKSSKHFTLLAHADDNLAFLRNTVGFELSRRLGLAYTPEQRPVEVVLNGDYIGLYMMTEQIRVDANRVNIVEQNDGETNPENITGGWLLEIDNYDDDCQIRMTEGNGALLRFTYHSPEVLSDEQKNYLTQYLQAADDAIYNSDKNSTLWEDYIDMEALVAFYIVQEMMDNAESFHGSCYLHKDRGENTKLVFGPVWDFGNSFRRGLGKFIYNDSPFGQNWIGEISRYPRFQAAVAKRWLSFIANDYASLGNFIDAFDDQISAAAACDGKRWPQYSQGNIQNRRDQFKNSIAQKSTFLRNQWGEATDISAVVSSRNNDDRPAVYSLDGRRISSATSLPKGIYIYHHRKVVVK